MAKKKAKRLNAAAWNTKPKPVVKADPTEVYTKRTDPPRMVPINPPVVRGVRLRARSYGFRLKDGGRIYYPHMTEKQGKRILEAYELGYGSEDTAKYAKITIHDLDMWDDMYPQFLEMTEEAIRKGDEKRHLQFEKKVSKKLGEMVHYKKVIRLDKDGNVIGTTITETGLVNPAMVLRRLENTHPNLYGPTSQEGVSLDDEKVSSNILQDIAEATKAD